MSFGDRFALVILILTGGAQVIRRSFLGNYLKYVFLLGVVGVFANLSYEAITLYKSWQGNPLTKFLLPPYGGISYFYSYAGYRIFVPWLVSFLAAIILGGFGEILNRKFDERFFEHEEIGFMRLGIFLTGYPGFIFYLAFVIVAELIFSARNSFLSLGRAPLYYFWLPLALITIVLKNFLIPKEISLFFNL